VTDFLLPFSSLQGGLSGGKKGAKEKKERGAKHTLTNTICSVSAWKDRETTRREEKERFAMTRQKSRAIMKSEGKKRHGNQQLNDPVSL